MMQIYGLFFYRTSFYRKKLNYLIILLGFSLNNRLFFDDFSVIININ